MTSMRNIFISPFHHLLWKTLIGTWTGIICTMVVLSRVNSHRVKTPSEDDEAFKHDAILWAIGTLCQKGS